MGKTVTVHGVFEHMLTCKLCKLSKTRTNVVVGEGPLNAEWMFVGEGPGKNEDETGRPFIGAAGNLLNDLLKEVGIDRSKIFIANIVKCRTADQGELVNRMPTPSEIGKCLVHLTLQIKTINPKVIITLGAAPLSLFLPGTKISIVHGKFTVSPKFNRTIYPIVHPAAALRKSAWKDVIRKDLQNLVNRKEQIIFGPRMIQ